MRRDLIKIRRNKIIYFYRDNEITNRKDIIYLTRYLILINLIL